MKAKGLSLVVLVVFVVALLSGTLSAAECKRGCLSLLNITSEQLKSRVDAKRTRGETQVFTTGKPYDKILHVFYDSLISLQMALNAGEFDEIILPEAVANYFMKVNEGYEISSITRRTPLSLVLGFRKDDDSALLNRFNEALRSIKADGTLAILVDQYIAEAGLKEPIPVKFDKFDNADTVKVAVTGDLPPIDFIAPDGTPAGFNTAVLAELAKRMKVNIELVNIESGARAAALASKRADVVFWFEYHHGANMQVDIPEGILLSEPYYTWNEIIGLKLKDKK